MNTIKQMNIEDLKKEFEIEMNLVFPDSKDSAAKNMEWRLYLRHIHDEGLVDKKLLSNKIIYDSYLGEDESFGKIKATLKNVVQDDFVDPDNVGDLIFCETCNGLGFLDPERTTICKDCNGHGYLITTENGLEKQDLEEEEG